MGDQMPWLPLVLLPAFPFDGRMWDRVRAGLADHVEMVTPDPRGFGRPVGAAEPDVGVLARDVLDLLDERGLDRVLLGGCSMGGYVSMAVLRAAPERVAGLLLVDTKPTADPQQAKENRFAMAERAERDGLAGWFAEDMLPVLLGAASLESRPDVVETVRRLTGAVEPGSVAWAQRAMAARPDSCGALRAADIPALVLHGEQDALIPLESARATAELLPQGELVVLPDTGHLPPLEAPAEVGMAITEWLERNHELLRSSAGRNRA
ncbi:MAG TPA: alpha/beta hydrolase [Actinophytocola sp.]|uniref:alpha/beta fold hydrolase n=1 Tax=Actinophytocola sp. TaxID=1872138 RepID=UPI002DB94BA1|nr:alpha/beta hydrolase [Actinophytocola sp.]HEU5470056.1 alpha/beta hydrolase [Actinophytocola sp.]